MHTHLSSLSRIEFASRNWMPLWNHSILSYDPPVIEQLKTEFPPEFTICFCGWMWAVRYELTIKWVSNRISPYWFDTLQIWEKEKQF